MIHLRFSIHPLGGLSICVINEGGVQSGVGVFPGWGRPSIRYAMFHFIVGSCIWLIFLMYFPRFLIIVLLAFTSTLFLPFSVNLYITQLFTLLHSLAEILLIPEFLVKIPLIPEFLVKILLIP